MRIILITSLTILLIGCTKSSEYKLNFSKIVLPENSNLQGYALDAVLAEDENYSSNFLYENCKLETDKTIYKPGEQIILTVENNTGKPMYFYPKEASDDADYYLVEDAGKAHYKSYLVSENPAFVTNVTYPDPAVLHLLFKAVNEKTAADLGCDSFKEPLSSGNKIIFMVTLPERAGFYRFGIQRYSHNPSQEVPDNGLIYSNLFQVTAD